MKPGSPMNSAKVRISCLVECPKQSFLSLLLYISQIYTGGLKEPPNETRRSIHEG
jgi:hypothetical protein